MTCQGGPGRVPEVFEEFRATDDPEEAYEVVLVAPATDSGPVGSGGTGAGTSGTDPFGTVLV
ncbi:hypothetical protein [Kitasatospora purpeofusca]|uniref:hypothetical protein n=1 Tax=Kitasatospora purpeofusca TaxID=67352 RepID=UPI00369AACE3